MQVKFVALGLATGISVCCAQSAGAIPAEPAAITRAAPTSETIQTQYYERHTRHYVTKCYRELIIGPYVCHRFFRYW